MITVQDPLEAYRAFTKLFIAHPKFQEAFDALRNAMMFSGIDDDADNLMFTGQTGAGKSTLARKALAEWARVPDGVRIPTPGAPDALCDEIPLLVFEFPPNPTQLTVGRSILRALGDPRWRRRDGFDTTDAVHELARKCRVRVILGDEAQRMVDRSGTILQDRLVDWLKGLRSATGAVVVLVGLGRLRALLANDEQIDRRWDGEIRLDHYRWVSASGVELVEDQADLIGILLGFMAASPVPFAAEVRPDDEDDDVNSERAFRFYYATHGVMGYLVKLLRTALKLAMGNPNAYAVIDRPLLARAFEKAFSRSRSGLENPFVDDFKWRVPNGKPGGRPNLPPPLADDRAPLASVRRRATKRDRARRIREALTK